MNNLAVVLIAIVAIGAGLGAGYYYKDLEVQNETEGPEENGNDAAYQSFILFETLFITTPYLGDHITVSSQWGYLATYYNDGYSFAVDYNDSDGDKLGTVTVTWQMDVQKSGKLFYDIMVFDVNNDWNSYTSNITITEDLIDPSGRITLYARNQHAVSFHFYAWNHTSHEPFEIID